MNYYYHPITDKHGEYTIFSIAKSLTQIGKDLAKQANAFGKDYEVIRVCTKDKFGCFNLHGFYRLEGDKIIRR